MGPGFESQPVHETSQKCEVFLCILTETFNTLKGFLLFYAIYVYTFLREIKQVLFRYLHGAKTANV